jgi:hypothetical protein
VSSGELLTEMKAIRKALKQLGYEDCYHYFSVLIENPPDSDMWVEAFEAKFEGKGTFGKQDWDQLLGHCQVCVCVILLGKYSTDSDIHRQAITDTPCNVFAEELLETYPEAKVILSVRDNVDVWYASYMNALQPFWENHYLVPGIMGKIRRALSPRPAGDGMAWKLLQHTYYKDFPHLGKQHYVQHNEKIRRLAKEQNREFLEFNVKDGWEPLCKFLGNDVPDTPFPFGNDTKEMQGLVRGIKEANDKAIRKNAISILSVVSAAAVAGFGIWYAVAIKK